MSNAEAQARWRAKNPMRARELVRNSLRKVRFGGNRQLVLERDEYKCTNCGMDDEQHRTKWGRGLTVDHIDGNGRYSKSPNHKLTNLTTLCLPCHGRKDALRGHKRREE